MVYNYSQLVSTISLFICTRFCCFFCDRIHCIAKIRPLFLQLEPMRTLAGQLKKDRDSALNKVTVVEQEMDKVITKIQVITNCCHIEIFYGHKLHTMK